MKAKRSTLLLALALLAPVALLARPDADRVATRADAGVVPMGPTADQSTAAKLVYGILSDSRYAYRPLPLDDALSQEVYKHYLDALDPSKQFFTAKDIEGFMPLSTRLDEAIKSGQLTPAYAIFSVYRKRVAERVAHARSLVKEDRFDFTTDERWEYDREEAPWAKDGAELDDLWRKSVMNDWLRLKMAGKKPEAISQTLDKRYANLQRSVEELDSEDVFQTFLNAYTSSVDPHTDYFTPKTAEQFNQQMSLSLEGIGAVLQRQDDMVVIREIVPGGPADLSKKLQPGARIVGVAQGDGAFTDVVGWRIDDVVELIRGKKGTRVRIEFIPPEAGVDGPPSTVTIVRDKVQLAEQAAKSEIMTLPASGSEPERRVGVIKLPAFYQDFEGRRRNPNDYTSASRDVRRLLEEFKAQKIDGVVMDLRANGGGSLDEAVDLTGLFIDQGPVVQVRESGGRVSVSGDTAQGVAWDGPLAVLINRASASASEIFAGAIQDYGRGLVIGETSFGKGTVQNLVDLDRWPANEGRRRFGQLKLTIAQFFRVAGGSTQHKGVVPDIAFPASIDATEYGEDTYPNALPWTRIAAVPHTQYGNFTPLLPRLETLHQARAKTDKEFQWWLEDVAYFREQAAKKYVSLNEAERRAERDRQEALRKQRQEERKRLGLPLDPLAADLSDDGLGASERDIIKDVAREKLAKERPDPLLHESAAILADAISVLSQDKTLATQVLPESTSPGSWAD
jgi:carboxyl-terminal processing protease